MTTAAKIDYDALAEQARKQAAPSSKKSTQAAVDYDALAAQARQAPAAAAALAAPALPTEAPHPEGFWASAVAPFVGMAKGVKSALYEGPQNPSEAAILGEAPGENPAWASPILGRVVLAMKRMLVDPQVEQGKQAAAEFRQAAPTSLHPTPEQLSHRQLAGGHALAAVIPMLGPWAANVGEMEGEQIGTGNYKGAAGTAVGNLALALAPKAAGKVGEALPGIAESGIRRLAGSGPGVASKLAREAAEDNRVIDLHNADKQAEAQQKWRDAQAKATADHQAELLRLRQKYAQDTRNATEKARTGTAEDRAQYQAKQLASKQKYEQDARDQTAKFQAERAKAIQENADAQREYNQKIGKTAQHNREVAAAERAQAQQAARLQVGGSQLIYGLRQLDKTLRDRACQMFDAVREKVTKSKQPPLPGTDLGTAARAALSKISGSSEIPKPFRDILAKYPESEPGAIEYQGAQIPRGHPLYDVLAKNGGASAPPVTFADLQGYYSETGAELSKGTLAGDVYVATKDLHNAIGDMMQKMANSAGASKEFWDSRVFYRNYMDTFHEPTGPSGSGSPVAQALLAKDPAVAVDKFTGDAGDRGVADLRKYSDSLANLAQDVQRTAQTKFKGPSGGPKSVADIPQPKAKPVPGGANLPLPPIQESAPAPRAAQLPLPPVLPDAEVVPYREPKLAPRRTISAGDLQRANDAAVRARAAGLAGHLFWWTGVWPAFRMLSELSKGAEVSLKPLALMPAAGAAGMATEELMGQPAVMEFLTRASRQQVARIPPDLRGQMPDVVSLAEKHGIKVSPILAAYAAAIQNNRGAQASQSAQQGRQHSEESF